MVLEVIALEEMFPVVVWGKSRNYYTQRSQRMCTMSAFVIHMDYIRFQIQFYVYELPIAQLCFLTIKYIV